MCNMDCFNCEYDDCINSNPPTKEESRLIREALKNGKDTLMDPREKKRKNQLTKYYAKNRERLKKYQLEYYQRNKEKICAAKRKGAHAKETK